MWARTGRRCPACYAPVVGNRAAAWTTSLGMGRMEGRAAPAPAGAPRRHTAQPDATTGRAVDDSPHSRHPRQQRPTVLSRRTRPPHPPAACGTPSSSGHGASRGHRIGTAAGPGVGSGSRGSGAVDHPVTWDARAPSPAQRRCRRRCRRSAGPRARPARGRRAGPRSAVRTFHARPATIGGKGTGAAPHGQPGTARTTSR